MRYSIVLGGRARRVQLSCLRQEVPEPDPLAGHDDGGRRCRPPAVLWSFDARPVRPDVEIAAFLPLTYVVKLMRGLWVGEQWSDRWLGAVPTAGIVDGRR